MSALIRFDCFGVIFMTMIFTSSRFDPFIYRARRFLRIQFFCPCPCQAASQSHIPFGSLFNFQGTMKRLFTYSHWENSNSNPKRKNIFEFENPSHLFGITSLNDTLFHRKNEKIFFIRLREFYFSCPEKPFHLFPLGATKCTP